MSLASRSFSWKVIPRSQNPVLFKPISFSIISPVTPSAVESSPKNRRLPNDRTIKGYGAGLVLFYRKPFLEDWGILFRLLAEGKFRPVISGEFPLLEAVRASALLESGEVVGNLVLVAPELLR